MSATALIFVLDAAILASIGAQPDLPDDFGNRGDIGASWTAPNPNGEEVIQSALEPQQGSDANDSHPTTKIVADPAVVRLFVTCAPFHCPPCNRLKRAVRDGLFDGFEVVDSGGFDGLKSYPAIRFETASSATGWGVVYGYDDSTVGKLRELTGTKRFVSQARNTNPVVSHNNLVSIHNRLHGGGQWTWPGDLATHLQTVHGVDLDAPVSDSQNIPYISQRNDIRFVSRRSPRNWRTGYSARQSCPSGSCPSR